MAGREEESMSCPTCGGPVELVTYWARAVEVKPKLPL